MKKIGLICLALVVAMGALGVGYAAWTDEVVITGTVNTGNVDLVIVDTSNTVVWKTDIRVDPDEIEVIHYWEATTPVPPGAISLVAYADTDSSLGTPPPSPLPGDDEILIRFWNLFPSIDFNGDFLLHYEGSIPVKVQVANITSDIPNLPYVLNFWESNAAKEKVKLLDGLEGVQMHYCDYVLVEFIIHLPQDPVFMNLNGTLSGSIKVIQWNEYVGP